MHFGPTAEANIRVAIVSKLLNNLSAFNIRALSDNEALAVFLRARLPSDLSDCRPDLCLTPGTAGPEKLGVSNSRIELHDGRTFVQPSLSDYYEALLRVTDFPAGRPAEREPILYALIRSFSPASLITLDGTSIISLLLQHSDYLIIEDTDLRTKDLSGHLQEFSLASVAAQDKVDPIIKTARGLN